MYIPILNLFTLGFIYSCIQNPGKLPDWNLKMFLQGIKLLISLSDPHNNFKSRYEKMTLGDLHKLVRDKNYFTDAETRIINVAIKERNILIHHCWENYIQRAMTSAGRGELRSEIIQKKNCILKASKIIDEFIDNHIKKYKRKKKY